MPLILKTTLTGRRCDLKTSRFNFDRRDIRPTYAVKQRLTTRDDVRAMGCSDQTLALLFPIASSTFILRQPEEWFWTDRGWFKRFPEASLNEIYQIAGGCFADLRLEEQAALLEISIADIVAEAAPGRGSWRSEDGAEVTIEEVALERTVCAPAVGIVSENHLPMAFRTLVAYQFRKINGFWFGFDESNKACFTPSLQYTERALHAQEIVLADPRRIFEARPRYFQSLWRTTTIDDVIQYVEIGGSSHLESMLRHGLDFAGIALSGHPDLTIRNDHLAFREVKGRDRMHGNQAIWVRDFARPLGLDVAIIRVSTAQTTR
jgi:hypothetical protein